MIRRCCAPTCKDFADYGAKGVTVCDRWRDLAVFAADMGPKPTPAHSIDRIDNSKGYEPGNCRWATQKEQQRNRTNNVRYELDGERLTAAEWAERRGLVVRVVKGRLKLGWPIAAALMPAAPGKRLAFPGGRTEPRTSEQLRAHLREVYAQRKAARGR